MSDEQLAQQLKAIADPVRLAILRLLPDTDDCEAVYNVSELAEEIGVAQPTVSHHLAKLKASGLVKCRKMCRDVYYWIERDEVDTVLDAVGNLVEDND